MEHPVNKVLLHASVTVTVPFDELMAGLTHRDNNCVPLILLCHPELVEGKG